MLLYSYLEITHIFSKDKFNFSDFFFLSLFLNISKNMTIDTDIL